MNSNSNYYDDFQPYTPSKKVEFCPTSIKCSAPGLITIPTGTTASTTFTPAFLTLKSSCFPDTCTQLEFTSNLILTGFTGALRFQIQKQCSNQFTSLPIGFAYTFSQAAALTASTTLSFFACDCDSCCHDCCTYSLLVTVTTDTIGQISLTNATLGAITTCQTRFCCDEE